MVYFAFTSLSTVGFGDFHPKSDFERLLCAMILLFGVAIFSYIMGIFIQILEEHQNLNADFDEGDELFKFFGIIKRFNGYKNTNQALKDRIEQHLEFKWLKDRNQAITPYFQGEIVDQLPINVVNNLYREFLYTHFLELFKVFFRVPKT